MGLSIFRKSIRIALKKEGTLIDRGAGIDFYAYLPCDIFLFDTWNNSDSFYEKIVIGVFYKGKIRYIPCLKSSLISESVKKEFQLDLEFYYKNTLYTFLWSGQWAFKIFGSQNIDYFLYDTFSVEFTPQSSVGGRPVIITQEKISFTTKTNIPQRFGMSYKWHFYSYRNGSWDERLSLFNCDTSANIFNGKNTGDVWLDYGEDGSPDSNYNFIIKAISEIEDEYCLVKIKSSGESAGTIDYEWKKAIDILSGTYTIEDFFTQLSNYVAENSYRVVANDFTISDGNFTINVFAGQRIWICIQGASPNFAKCIRFVDDTNDYSGSVPEAVKDSPNYNFYGNDTTGFANVFKRKGFYGTYSDVPSYNVTITNGILFK